jgi:hypothetical protein
MKSDSFERNIFILLFVTVIIATSIAVTLGIHDANKGYDAVLPDDAVRVIMPNIPYKYAYTNDYDITSGILIVHSYYTENIYGHYKLVIGDIASPEYSIFPEENTK